MKWRILEHSKGRIELLDEGGELVADNEPYYPHAIELRHAKRICSTMNYFNEMLKLMKRSKGENVNEEMSSLLARIQNEFGE